MSSSYLAVVRGLRELHQLRSVGREDSPEADLVRDASDTAWEGLTEVERKRLSGLSEDLYSVSDPEQATVREMNPQAQSRLVDTVQAQQHGEWDRALEILRRWSAYLDPSLLSYLRGSIWLEAGDPATAFLFLQHASDLQPDNGNYLTLSLTTLSRFAPSEARARADVILDDPDKFAPVVIAHAAEIALEPALGLPEAEASHLSRRLIPILESTLNKVTESNEGVLDASTQSMTCALLGFCHEYLGQNQAALGYYSKGLVVAPSNDALLVARGILLYGESPRAVADFELAIKYGSPMVWAYFFLAHHNLVSGLFEQCRSLCQRALELDGPDAMKSELAEWLAISQSELGFPVEIVKESFEASIRFDPTNERARRNLAVFESAAKPIPARVYETRSKSAIKSSGLSRRRVRPAA
jgi:tetratricopeptide (TPR) repeat protein